MYFIVQTGGIRQEICIGEDWYMKEDLTNIQPYDNQS